MVTRIPAGTRITTDVSDSYLTVIDKQTFTTSGTDTWTKPIKAKWIYVRGVSGSGAGGSCALTGAAQCAIGGGGGGGGYFEKWIPASDVGDTEVVTVGAAGAAAAAGANDGGNGGSSSYGSHCSATGGSGGSGAAAAGSAISGSGAGGVASNGDINIPGEAGDEGRWATGVVADATRGGNSVLGFGGNQASSINGAAGNPGQLYGGAGSGGLNTASQGTGKAGGAGAAGIVIVITLA